MKDIYKKKIISSLFNLRVIPITLLGFLMPLLLPTQSTGNRCIDAEIRMGIIADSEDFASSGYSVGTNEWLTNWSDNNDNNDGINRPLIWNLTCSAGSTEISGTVFEDFDYDGICDAIETTGIENITVTATDSLGNAFSDITDNTGAYTITGLIAGRTYRVDFTNIPSWAKSTFSNNDNGTTVQFLLPSSCANLGLSSPSFFCESNPTIALSCFQMGTGVDNPTDPGFISFPWTNSGNVDDGAPAPAYGATFVNIGAVWGQAYQRYTEQAFVSTILRRHSAVGPTGLGGIYQLDNTGALVGSFDLHGVIPANGGIALDFGFREPSNCTNPMVSAFAIQPSCTDGVAGNDGYLQLSSVTDGDRYHWSTGSTFNDNGGTNTYANANDLTGATYPIQFNSTLGNMDTGDFTIRVYNGVDDCFTDVVVTLNTQDCTVECNCQDNLYVNDDSGSEIIHKFLIDETDGSLTEIGNPWNVGDAQKPHGIAVDINGFVYIGNHSAPGNSNGIYKFNCDGVLIEEDFIPPTDQYSTLNYAAVDGYLYKPDPRTEDMVNAFDLCDGSFVGAMELPDNAHAASWGFIIKDGYWYYTGYDGKIYRGMTDISLFTNPPTNAAQVLFTVSDAPIMGITMDDQDNIYIVTDQNRQGDESNPMIRKYSDTGSGYMEVAAVGDNSNGGANTGDGEADFWGIRSLAYSSASGYIYAGNFENCVSVFDTNLVQLSTLNIGNPTGGEPKAIGITEECCPTNNNITIDTVLCAASINDQFYLQELINCSGAICEGLWTPGGSNSGLIYNSCNNSVTIDALTACGTFTLESDGTGNNPQCGAFKIEVNISVNVVTASVVAADQTICAGGDPAAFTVTAPATGGTLTYQWQSSPDSLTGYADISGAMSATYDPPAGLTDTTYYRVLVNSSNAGCSTGTCADTSNYITINVRPIPEVAAFAIQPSCVDGVAQTDGYIQLSAVSGGDRYHWSAGSTFDDDGGAKTATNATDLTGAMYPVQFNMTLGNANVGDYTIRVYDGVGGCYTDIVVTLNTQDCTVGCDCEEMIYLNEPTTDGAVHKFSVATDGTLTEIGSPWFDNAIAMEGVNSPHGLAIDLNGFIYIGEGSASGDIRKFTCDGDIFPESEFVIPNGGQTNMSTINNILYTNRASGFNFDFINAYDLCTVDLIGVMEYCEDVSVDWGLFIDHRTNEMYATADGLNAATSRFYYFSQSDFDLDPNTCRSEVTLDVPLPQGNWQIYGVTTDIDRNVYMVVRHTDGRSYILKYGPAPGFQYIGQSAIDSGEDGTVYSNGGYGYGKAIGIIYSETANRLYVSTTSPIEDCVSLFDTTLTYLGSAVPPVPGSDNAKGIGIIKECCPTNNNITIDTTLCAASINDQLFLQELINCSGTICEGLWQEGGSNSGLTYNSCNNSVTIDALDACGSFTLESDGTGNAPQCGAFKIEVNISVNVVTASVVAADQTICAGGDPAAFTVTTPATGGTLTYQWQSSTDSLTGYVDISGAMSATYDPPAGLTDTTYYRVLVNSSNAGCSTGTCADTSNYITINVRPIPEVAAFAIQPSCVDGVAQTDGYLQLSSISNGDRYHWSTGSTFNDNGGANTYTNATDLTGAIYPLQFNTGLSNTDVGDFTIRVFNGAGDCFTDVVVTMNTQDCMVECDCQEYLYSNDTDNDLVHKFLVNPTDSTLIEVGNPWFEPINRPHGGVMDLNGVLYFAEKNDAATSSLFKIDCDGNFIDTLFYGDFDGTQFNNFVMDGNILYVNGAGGDNVKAYDICEERFIGTIDYCCGNLNWELFEGADGNMYTTDKVNDSLYIYNVPYDTSLYNGTVVLQPTFKLFDAAMADRNDWGVETDLSGNWYVVLHNNSFDTRVLKFDASGTKTGEIIDAVSDGVGFFDGRGVVWSEATGLLYVASDNDDCVAVIAASNMTYLLNLSIPGGGGKDLSLVKECCPTNNTVTIDTTLCTASLDDVIFLQDLIGCDGGICEGVWQEGGSNTGLTYDPCDNSVTITALDACGSFTLESDGTGNNPQCGAFKIEVNISLTTVIASVIGSDQTICNGGDPAAFTVTVPATGGTLTYQWQNSADSLTGYADISGAMSATYDPPAGLTDTTYYRVLVNSANAGCSTGTCADTSNYITVNTLPCDWGDLPDTSATTNASDYQTTNTNNGPVHVIIPGLSLGSTVDAESDGQPSNDALGDDVDEDGIQIWESLDLTPGGTFRLPLSYTNTTGSPAHIEAWIDWNNNGEFDTGEMVFDVTDPSSGLYDRLEVTIPTDAVTGEYLGLRIRISNQDNMTPYGLQPNGEVEDYLIGIECATQICIPINANIMKK